MGQITYDGRSLIINGKRELIVSGAIHYPRSTPAMWPRLLRESRKAGLNCIETYVFWGRHERQEGQYDFTGRLDLRRFIKLCQAEGLYVILRIGPYICAETNFGGLPWWLVTKPGLVTRTWNEPFMTAMARWVHTLMAQVGDLQVTQGGPIILAQMENEYKNVAARYGRDGDRYLAWSGKLGREAGIRVPLVMCWGAPKTGKNLIETHNGFSVWQYVAETLMKERPHQPALWTENWPGWYDVWNQPHHLRRADEIAYEVLRFFAIGGTGVNYYMWHGGTNFGRDAMYLQTTSYDFDAPLDEYGLATTKSEHLKRLHEFFHAHADFFLEGRRGRPEVLRRGENGADVILYPFRRGRRELTIAVNATAEMSKVIVGGVTVSLAPHTAAAVLTAGGQGRVVYHTAAAPARPIRRRMTAAGGRLKSASPC